MDSLQTSYPKLSCSHQSFTRRDTDEFVSMKPIKTFEVHNCGEITCWQDNKGLKRYFIVSEPKTLPVAEKVAKSPILEPDKSFEDEVREVLPSDIMF